jgi:hypothetical protein
MRLYLELVMVFQNCVWLLLSVHSELGWRYLAALQLSMYSAGEQHRPPLRLHLELRLDVLTLPLRRIRRMMTQEFQDW